jgi:hypothetical protein
MTWTTDYPTKPGFYWIRNYLRNVDEKWKPYEEVTAGPDIIEVDKDLEFYFTGSEVARNAEDLVSAEWQGPIEPAQELEPSACMVGGHAHDCRCHEGRDVKPLRRGTDRRPTFKRALPDAACAACAEIKPEYISWPTHKIDGDQYFSLICRPCWIKRLTPEQRKVYMV